MFTKLNYLPLARTSTGTSRYQSIDDSLNYYEAFSFYLFNC